MREKDYQPEEDDVSRRFEGRARLQKLLEGAGTVADVDDVAEAFVRAQGEGVPSPVVISALFDDEPRFSSPHDARALFGNLLGLWDLLAEGGTIDAPPKERPPKRIATGAPGLFPKEGPSTEWVEAAWRHIDDAPKKEQLRWEHAFENRQDALLSWLDDTGLSDDGFGAARHVLSEIHTLIELGWEAGVGQVFPTEADKTGEAPEPLKAWLEEAVFEAEHHDERPMPAEEAERFRTVTSQALAAMWRARKT